MGEPIRHHHKSYTMNTSYHGWKNRATWNIAMWLQNHELYFCIAQRCHDFPEFIRKMKELKPLWKGDHEEWMDGTPDGVSFTDPDVCHQSLTDLINML